MSMNAQSLFQQALLMLGVYDPGEAPSTTEQADLLLVINNMLDNWSLERINIPVIVVATHALTTTVAAYTFGPGGDFGVRYVRFDTVGILLPSAAVSGTFIRTPVRIVTQEEFQNEVDKGAASQTPQIFYYDYQFPTATGNLWPAPGFTGTAPQLEVAGWQSLAEFPDTTTVVNTPQGYDRALVLNFAIEIAPQYPGVGQVPPTLPAMAAEAKAAIRAMNASNFGQPSSPPPSSPLNAIPQQAAPPAQQG